MTLNNKQEYIYTLTAVNKDHGIKDFEKETKPYSVFGGAHQKQQYIIIDDEFNSNELYRSLVKFLSSSSKPVSVDLNSMVKLVKEDKLNSLISIVVSALEYAEATPFTLKSNPVEKNVHNLVVDTKYEELVKKHETIAKEITITRGMQDAPSNLMTPGDFEEQIRNRIQGLDIKMTVLNRMDLVKKGMNLHVGVGGAAVSEKYQPRLIVLEYMNNPSNENKMAFVGKGVCFDTGGYNVKTGPHMRHMKFDMSGAAISASTLISLAKNKEKVNAYAVLPLVFNLLGAEAQRPDDVLKSYNGKTVEIDNTDAEGRLILADALTYAVRDLKVNKIFDIATLTGAMIYALGDTYSGVWSTCDCMWKMIEKSADEAGELVWRLPFHNDFLKMLDSHVADIANSVSDPRGGSSRAAVFLREFTEGVTYAHFDVAITADVGHKGTGVMLKTFYNFINDWFGNK
ncbi:leucyl aminopeptidase [Ureaplasma canigenitalium]|uniref:leucyl aminopeptidase n=1 Tax=Ureaplasma canigenitalium TaxID=42092 RepID=UPI0004E221DF|nr:leucyl aminopeptidase [Ureaplasma canigenitalium]